LNDFKVLEVSVSLILRIDKKIKGVDTGSMTAVKIAAGHDQNGFVDHERLNPQN
jgi:hypothetical protein